MLYQNCDNFQKKKRECSPKLLLKYKDLRGPPPKPQKEMHRDLSINGSFWPSNWSKLLIKGMLEKLFKTVTEKKSATRARLNPYNE